MNNEPYEQPDQESFYLVCIDKPDVNEIKGTTWQEWTSFLKSLADAPLSIPPCEKLTECAFLFPARNGVLDLAHFLELCKKFYIQPTVFFLPAKPELCKQKNPK